jgi:hypothetical protein
MDEKAAKRLPDWPTTDTLAILVSVVFIALGIWIAS